MITVCPLNWEWYSQSQMPTFDCCQEGYRQTIHSNHYLIQESHKWWKNTASAHLSQWKAGSSKHSTPKWDAISDVCCLDEGRAMEDVILIRLFGGGIWWNCHLNLWCSLSIVTIPRWERPCAFIAAITTSWCVIYSLDFKKCLGICWLLMGCDYIYPPPCPSQNSLSQARLHWYVDVILRIL